MKINDENYEAYLLRYKEGELDADERAQVERALAERPDWRELADLYDPDLKLTADASEVFPHKERLLFGNYASPIPDTEKPAAAKGKVVPLWTKLSVAASVVLLFSIGAHRWATHGYDSSNANSERPLTAQAYPEPRIADGSSAEVVPASRPETRRPQSATTVEASLPPKAETRQPEPESAEAAAETATIRPEAFEVTYSDQLIAYLDDNVGKATPDETLFPIDTKPDIIMTDQLITYLDPNEEAPLLPRPQQRPEWRYAMEDWFNGIRLARLEFETSVVTKLCDLTVADNTYLAKKE